MGGAFGKGRSVNKLSLVSVKSVYGHTEGAAGGLCHPVCVTCAAVVRANA